MDDAVRAWVETTLGGTIVAEERPSVGGSREVTLVDLERGDADVVSLVVRAEGGGCFAGTEISLAREAVVYEALADTAVPVPRIVARAPDGGTLVLERLAGTDELPPVGSDQRAEIMGSFVDALAALHALDADSLHLPGLPRPTSPVEHARLDLELWARLAARVTAIDPLVAFAGAWLWANAPTTLTRTVLVQGDTGPGNFLAEDGRVTGLIDWEFAHLGDPMDDWAWLELRADAAELAPLHARYTEQTGTEIHGERVAYYRIAVEYRCAVTTSLSVHLGGGARGWAPYLLATQRYLDGLATGLGRQLGGGEVTTAVSPVPSPRGPYFDALSAGVRAAVRSLDDPDRREETRNLQILVRYLRAHDERGAELEALEAADRLATFGDAVDDARIVERAEAAGRTGDVHVFRYLMRRRGRERQLWADLLDRRREQ